MTIRSRSHLPTLGCVEHGKSVSIHTLYHVGNLDAKRTVPYISQEGGELSVTLHPREWKQIIRSEGLAGNRSLDTYELTNPSGRFYYVDPTAELETEREWCLDAGYIEEVTGYRVIFTDENGDQRYLKVETEAIAREEAEARQGSFEQEPILSLAQQGREYWRTAFNQPPGAASPVLIEGMLPIWYAAHLGTDGVWWDEELAPEKLSAPRGCVFQDKLTDWTWEICDQKNAVSSA